MLFSNVQNVEVEISATPFTLQMVTGEEWWKWKDNKNANEH